MKSKANQKSFLSVLIAILILLNMNLAGCKKDSIETTIKYNITNPGNVSIKLFDTFGNEMGTLVNQYQQTGEYYISLNSEELNLSNGVYFYRLNAGNISETKSMIINK